MLNLGTKGLTKETTSKNFPDVRGACHYFLGVGIGHPVFLRGFLWQNLSFENTWYFLGVILALTRFYHPPRDTDVTPFSDWLNCFGGQNKCEQSQNGGRSIEE